LWNIFFWLGKRASSVSCAAWATAASLLAMVLRGAVTRYGVPIRSIEL
jgi:hypothetical protein